MGRKYKKALWASIITFIIGTSCCWITSLAIWIGGAAVFGVISNYIENIQLLILALGVILGLVAFYLYRKKV